MAKIALNVRIKPEMRARLQEIAMEQNRTLSNLVETALKRVIAESATGTTARTEPKNRRG